MQPCRHCFRTLQDCVRWVRHTLALRHQFIFGAAQDWADEWFDLQGCDDLVNLFFLKYDASASPAPIASSAPAEKPSSASTTSRVSSAPTPSQTQTDPRIHMAKGVNQIYLEPEIRDRLDKLLGHLESAEGVSGNGTMLILGTDSCLLSRFPQHETRMVWTVKINEILW